MNVIKSNGFPIAGRLRQPYISGYHRFKDLPPVKISQVSGYGRRQVGALVVHGKQQSFDS